MKIYKMSLNTLIMAVMMGAINLPMPVAVNAYDGDVDYSAPYLTVDPETGKLVTIDPRAEGQQQTQTQHQAPAGSGSSTQATADQPGTAGDPGSEIMAQAGGNNSLDTEGQPAGNSLVKPFIVTLLLSGVIVLFIVLSRRSKPAKAVESADDDAPTGH